MKMNLKLSCACPSTRSTNISSFEKSLLLLTFWYILLVMTLYRQSSKGCTPFILIMIGCNKLFLIVVLLIYDEKLIYICIIANNT